MASLKVAYSVQPLAAKAKVALVAYGPFSAGLSNLPFFLRTTQSNKDQMAMMVSRADSIHSLSQAVYPSFSSFFLFCKPRLPWLWERFKEVHDRQ